MSYMVNLSAGEFRFMDIVCEKFQCTATEHLKKFQYENAGFTLKALKG